MTDSAQLFRPDIQKIAGYLPGEQPQTTGWVKLNTNENPYPPSPLVAKAIQSVATAELNKYPDPLTREFNETVANLFSLTSDSVLAGNGSDEILTILVRSFVDAGDLILYPYPSYILYETLAQIQGAHCERLPLNPDWSWDRSAVQNSIQKAKLLFVPNPNSPSGNRWTDEDILSLVPPEGILVLDEAYGDFCDSPHCAELLQTDAGSRIVITRTLSKSYSLAGIRMGFAMAHPVLIAGMRKVKDSYNCNTLSLAAALAALKDQSAMLDSRERIRNTRTRLHQELTRLGFDVVPSQANFLWCTHPEQHHEQLYLALKEKKILVRYMQFHDAFPALQRNPYDGIRITIGTNEEIDQLLNSLKEILSQ